MVVDFFVENYVLLIILIGTYIMTTFDAFLEKSMLRIIRTTMILILSLVICDRLETYMGNLEHFTQWRVLFSALCYSIRPVIIMMLMFIVVKKVSKLLFIPAVINMLIAFSAFFTDISYGFDEKLNSFYRNPLGYTPYVVTILYIVLLFFFTIKKISKTSLQEDIALVFIPVTAMIAAVMSFYDHDEVVNLTYGAEILLYYLYVYTQYTKRDALTGLLNRQAFYRDTEKGNYSISGVISIDMNYLKQINDTHGHHAGDKALKSVAKCFVDAIGSTDRVYRIGGDEFVVLCKDRSQEDIEKLAEEMRSAVTQSGYSCAFGICSGDTVKKMIKQADRLMYGDKVRIKAQTDTVGEGG